MGLWNFGQGFCEVRPSFLVCKITAVSIKQDNDTRCSLSTESGS